MWLGDFLLAIMAAVVDPVRLGGFGEATGVLPLLATALVLAALLGGLGDGLLLL